MDVKFTYRLYEGSVVGTPTLSQAMGIVSFIVNGLTINSRRPLRQQLEEFIQNNQNSLQFPGLDLVPLITLLST